jgi:hypothetical protein
MLQHETPLNALVMVTTGRVLRTLVSLGSKTDMEKDVIYYWMNCFY